MKYYSGLDTERYNFYRIPKSLVTDIRFRKLSSDSKILYGIMLDRMTSLSKQNHWIDQEDHAYIIFPVVDIATELECSKRKVQTLLTELESYGMIERKRIGLGQANYIYLYNFFDDTDNQSKIVQRKENSNRKKTLLTSDQWREKFECQIECDILQHDHPEWKDLVDNIVDIMLGVVLSKRTTVKVNGTECDKRTVIRQFCKLNRSHVEYVIYTLMETSQTKEIVNIQSYIITALYNAPQTMHMYYSLKTNYDMYNYSPKTRDHIEYPEAKQVDQIEVQKYAHPEMQEYTYPETQKCALQKVQRDVDTEVQNQACQKRQKDSCLGVQENAYQRIKNNIYSGISDPYSDEYLDKRGRKLKEK